MGVWPKEIFRQTQLRRRQDGVFPLTIFQCITSLSQHRAKGPAKALGMQLYEEMALVDSNDGMNGHGDREDGAKFRYNGM